MEPLAPSQNSRNKHQCPEGQQGGSMMTKKKRAKSGRKQDQENLKPAVKKNWEAADQILELTDTFCMKHLDGDYRDLCEDMIAELLDMDMPLDRGKPAGWASGIVHAVGFVNFLQDPSQSPHMTSPQIAEGFGVSQQTMQTKSKRLRDELDLIQFDPDWCLPALLRDNPLVWMLEIDGIIMDIRQAPREAQEEAYRLGLIPFIPANESELESSTDSGAKIIQFPSGQNKNSNTQSERERNDYGPTLFD